MWIYALPIPLADIPQLFFFFNDTAPTEIYTLSLHDALPICGTRAVGSKPCQPTPGNHTSARSEEHTSELQSRLHLVCRLLLEKKKPLLENTRPPRQHQSI